MRPRRVLERVFGRRPPDAQQPAVRRSFFDDARALTPYLAVESDDLMFFVSTSDRLGRGLFTKRARQDMGILARALQLVREHGATGPGATFVDVGANIGTTTVTALRRHGFAAALALEPEPGNVLTLKLNLLANGVESSVTVLQAAASNLSGEARLGVSTRSSGEHVLLAGGESDAADAVVVHVVTLDELAKEGTLDQEDVGLLWVDAAGAEARVLAGASTLLARGVPLVAALRPGLPDWDETRSELVRLLTQYTHFANVRRPQPTVSEDLAALLADPQLENGDLLAFRV